MNFSVSAVAPARAEGGLPWLDARDLCMGLDGPPLSVALNLSVPAVARLGHMTLTELALLVGTVRACAAESVFEIGTFDGLTVHNLLLNCPALRHVVTVDLPARIHGDGGDGTLYPLDVPNAEMLGTCVVGHRFHDHPRSGIVAQHRQDSATMRAEQFAGRYDVVIVDGAHTYRYCRHDGELAFALSARPALIFYHDFGKFGPDALPGVTHHLLELAAQGTPHLYRLRSGDEPTSLVLRLVLPGER